MSSALQTVTDYINDARTLLQDTIAPYRYDDPSLLIALNVTLLEGRRVRPDLFVYSSLVTGQKSVQSFDTNDGQTVFIEEQFRLAFLHGLCGHALTRDQEDIQDERAGAFLKTMSDILLGVRPSTMANAQGGGG